MFFAMVFKACHDLLVLCRFYAVGNMILVPQWFILGLFGYGIWKPIDRRSILLIYKWPGVKHFSNGTMERWRFPSFGRLHRVQGAQVVRFPVRDSAVFLSKRPENWRGKFTALTMMEGIFQDSFYTQTVMENPLSWGKTMAFTMFLPGPMQVPELGIHRFREQNHPALPGRCKLEEQGITLDENWWCVICVLYFRNWGIHTSRGLLRTPGRFSAKLHQHLREF